MFDMLLKSAGIAPEDLKNIPEIIKKAGDNFEIIKLLLADLLEEDKMKNSTLWAIRDDLRKTNYYLHRQEQRELKKRDAK